MEVKWIKIVVDVFDDEKIRIIESMPSGDTLVCIWFKLLCLAGKCNAGGLLFISDRVPYSDEMLAVIFRKDAQVIRAAIDIFERFGMIDVVDDAYAVVNWEKHQALEKMEKLQEDHRNRNRRYRERKRAELSEGNPEADASGTSRGRETDTKETQQNKNKNKNKKEEIYCAQSARSCTVLDEFNTLWSMYPAGRKQGKERAYKAYTKARETGEDYETVRSGLAAYVAYITREHTETRYVKMAQTWFAGHCWKDEYGEEPESDASYDRQAFYEAAKKRGEGDDE